MSGIVFINYRRKDAPGMAGRLFDRLEQDFSEDQLFFDVDNIPPGKDFVAYLNEQVEACDVLLAVVGPDWQSQLDGQEYEEAGKQTKDFVRIEIEAALKQGKTVIPVLVSGVEMPREEDLPEALQPFARRNAVRLSHERFKADAAGITTALKAALAEADELRAAAGAEAARLRAEEERKAKAEREAKEQAEKDTARREAAVGGLSREEITKAEELANWNFIAERTDIQKLRDHQARFPKGTTAAMAAEKLEALLWHELGETPTIAALRLFLEEFPEAAHAAKAKQRLDELETTKAAEREAKKRAEKERTAWEAVKDTTDVEMVQAFLRDWPKSPHRAEARRLKNRLTGGFRRKMLVGTSLAALAVAVGITVALNYQDLLPDSVVQDTTSMDEPPSPSQPQPVYPEGTPSATNDDVASMSEPSSAGDGPKSDTEGADTLGAQGKLEEGLAAHNKGDYDAAIADYTKAIELNPEYAVAYFNRGNSYRHKGDPDRAITDFTKAIELNPKDADAYQNRAYVYYSNKGEYDRAIADLTKAIELNPNDAGARGSLSYSLLFRDFAKALATADEAIALAPDKIWLHTNRAHALMFLGRVKEARALYLKHRGTKIVDGQKSWETVILDDFAALRNAKLTNPLMDEIEKKFAAGG